jgi:hypothetical protein
MELVGELRNPKINARDSTRKHVVDFGRVAVAHFFTSGIRSRFLVATP